MTTLKTAVDQTIYLWTVSELEYAQCPTKTQLLLDMMTGPCKSIILKLKICTVYGNLFHGQTALDCVTSQKNVCVGGYLEFASSSLVCV